MQNKEMQIKCSNLNFYLRNRKNAQANTDSASFTVFAIVLLQTMEIMKEKNRMVFFSNRHLSIPYTFSISFIAIERCSFSFARRLLLKLQKLQLQF